MAISQKKSLNRNLIKPMLATLTDAPFDSDDWVFEIKWDGYRALCRIQDNTVLLYSRNLLSFNDRFEAIVQDLHAIKEMCVLDGEIVVLDKAGKPSFQLMQNYQDTHKGDLVYMVFDILNLQGVDLTNKPLVERKKILKKLLSGLSKSHIRYCEHIVSKGKEFFEEAAKANLEGIIAKRSQSQYIAGVRSKDWLKIKTHMRQEAIICGFTEPKGSRAQFGSLVVGVYDKDKLIFAGHVGTGFDEASLKRIYDKLQPLVTKTCPFDILPPTAKKTIWVQPKQLCEVQFAEWTKDHSMRHAVFIGLRDDKNATEVTEETPLSNLNKVFWPKEKYTKGDLLEYYKQISRLIIPHLKDRPETLKRYPNGIKGTVFYQKNLANHPPWIHTEEVQHSGKTVQYIIINNEESLLYAVNLGCIDLNPFTARIGSLHNPDFLIIDLDPEDIDFSAVVQVAQCFHKLFKKLALPSYCKTSGATGLHIYLPMQARYSYDQVRMFAQALAQVVLRTLPDITSMQRSPSKRQKKVYLDCLQNAFGQTVASAYSVRAVPGACVSTPLQWKEVKPGLNPQDFTIKTVLKRFKKLGDIFAPVLEKGIDIQKVLPLLEKL